MSPPAGAPGRHTRTPPEAAATSATATSRARGNASRSPARPKASATASAGSVSSPPRRPSAFGRRRRAWPRVTGVGPAPGGTTCGAAPAPRSAARKASVTLDRLSTASVGETATRRLGAGAAAETPGGAQAAADAASSTSPPEAATANRRGGAPGSSAIFVGAPPGAPTQRSRGASAPEPSAPEPSAPEPGSGGLALFKISASGVAAGACSPGATTTPPTPSALNEETRRGKGHPFATMSEARTSTASGAGAPGRLRAPCVESARSTDTASRRKLFGNAFPFSSSRDVSSPNGATSASDGEVELAASSGRVSPNRPTALTHEPVGFPNASRGTSSSRDGARGSAPKMPVGVPGGATPSAAVAPSASRTTLNRSAQGSALVSTAGARATRRHAEHASLPSASTPAAETTSGSRSAVTATKRARVSGAVSVSVSVSVSVKRASHGPLPAAVPSLPTGTGHAAVGGTTPLDSDRRSSCSKAQAEARGAPISGTPRRRRSSARSAAPPASASPHPSGSATSRGVVAKPASSDLSRDLGVSVAEVAPRQEVTSSTLDTDASERVESSPMRARRLVHRRRLVALSPLLCDPRGGGHRVTQLTP